MTQVKDLLNDIIYAEGNTDEEIVASWNENLKAKFSWVKDSGDFFEGDEEYKQLEELFEEATKEVYGTEEIKDVIYLLNEAYDSQFIEAIDEEGKALEWSNLTNSLVDRRYYR